MTITEVFTYDSPIVYDAQQQYDVYVPLTTPSVITPLTHLAAPVTLQADGSFMELIQDTIEEVAQSVEVICGSVQGERTVVPTFGMPLQNFESPNPGDYVQAVGTWDQRASVQVTVKDSDIGASNVSVSVALARGSTT